MKKVTLTFSSICFILLNLFAQKESKSQMPINEDTKLINYEEVIMVEGAKKEELKIRLNTWFNNFFKNPQGTLQEFTDEHMTGKHGFNIYKEVKGQKTLVGVVKYSFEIALKDGKYKYSMTDFFLSQVPKFPIEKWMDENSPNKSDNYNYLQQVDAFIKNFITTLKTKMNEPIKTKKDNW